MTAIIDPTPDEVELRAAAHRLVNEVVTLAGGTAPAPGSPAWWEAQPVERLAGLLVLAEAWLVHDPQLAVAERFKAMSVDLSQACDWSAAGSRPSHADLQRIRKAAA